MEDIYLKIKAIRVDKKITQEEMASRLSMAQGNYAKLERGTTSLTVERLRQIAEIFEMTQEAVLSYSDSQPDLEDIKYYIALVKKQERTIDKLQKELNESNEQEGDFLSRYLDEIEALKKKVAEGKKSFVEKENQLKEKEESISKLEQELQAKNRNIEHLQKVNEALLRMIESSK